MGIKQRSELSGVYLILITRTVHFMTAPAFNNPQYEILCHKSLVLISIFREL